MKLRYCLLALLILPHVYAAERVVVYTQYDYPPFWHAADRGLTHDLAQALTQHSQGRYQFEVEITPRKRLDHILASPNWQGIIPWVAPIWFRDEQQTRFGWSGTLLHDADLIIGHQALQFNGPASLSGKRLGGILGHRYAEFEALIQAGQIIRDDAPSQELNLKKLRAQRIDFMFIPYSSWNELKLNDPNSIKGLYVASQVRNRYERRILISPHQPALKEYVQQTVELLRKDPAWLKHTQPYGGMYKFESQK
jgi:polar amino acid transport system substrate-binding protein